MTVMAVVTRAKLTCPVYGIACELTSHQLPTIHEVMKHYSFVRTQRSKTVKSSDIVAQVADNVNDVWIKASIPTVTIQRVKQKIESLHQNVRSLLKRKGEAKDAGILLAQQEGLSLFDISACQCLDFNNCNCPKQCRVPTLEREFLSDQRNERKMRIGSLDKEVSCKLSKKSEREAKRQKYYESVVSNDSAAGASGGTGTDSDLTVIRSGRQR